jgi:ubiquinone/menaquinone biosynthesis C-methylase UbiE
MKDIDLVVDASKIPFDDNHLDAIVMMDVLHHVKNPEEFLKECKRVVKKNGLILLIEPANTWFSRIIYKNFHHEDFDENADWKLKKDGRLSSANQAIPYIIFERDKKIFNEKFPELTIEIIKKFKPFHYLLSGGLTYKILFNRFFTSLFLIFEKILIPFNNYIGLFMLIRIKKNK